MEQESPRIWFENQLRRTLNGLYDHGTLLNTPLPELFQLSKRCNTASALRKLLIEAIETLRPAPSTPTDSTTWRVYQILRRRYIEQLTQQEVATNLGLSVRQLQRSEKLAREVLTDYLWSTYNLAEPVHKAMIQALNSSPETEYPPSMAQELEWLHSSVPAQSVHFVEVFNEIIDILNPLTENTGRSLSIHLEANLPEIYVKTAILRQALLNILNTAIQSCCDRSPVNIHVRSVAKELEIHLQTPCAPNTETLSSSDFSESISMAQRLIELCQGQLRIVSRCLGDLEQQEDVFEVIISLPTRESIDVLVVDDNADVLQLYERYLAGSRYRFRGTQDPKQGLALATEIQPGVILLDVMMPGRDGWTLLSQLREHPKTQDIPVIVCSILSQEQFALALGAAAFIRKPVTRQAFLQVLDQQLAPQLRESG